MSLEASRTQFLVRTGLKGAGQNIAFKYGGGTSQRSAEADARALLAKLSASATA